MVNPKLVSVFCGIGFILSFLIGLISGNPFLTVLIRAFISCISFGAIAAAISFAYNRFLNVRLQDVPETVSSVSDVTDAFNAEDEALTEDNGPGFYVDETSKGASFKNMSPSVTGAVKDNETVASGKSSGSVTSQTEGLSSLDVNSGADAASVVSDKVSSVSQPVQERALTEEQSFISNDSGLFKNNSDELDELPEIASAPASDSAETVESIIDSDDGGTKTQFVPAGLEEIASSNDASVMASAIRTVLASDN
jgi:hypothetical protein